MEMIIWKWLDLWLKPVGEKEYEWTIWAFLATVARGYGRALISSPSGSGRSSAAKRFLLNFELKMKQGIF